MKQVDQKGVKFVTSQKVNGDMIFTDYWNFHVLNFLGMGMGMRIRSVFELKGWWKDDIYWLLKSSLFEIFGDARNRLFFSQNIDGKMIFAWSFWAFHGIPGLWKYGFLRSDFFYLNISELFFGEFFVLF